MDRRIPFFPQRLKDRLAANEAVSCFHLRAVFVRVQHGDWGMLGCVIKEIVTDIDSIPSPKPLIYAQVYLYEEILTGRQLRNLLTKVENGDAKLGEANLTGTPVGSWDEKFVPAKNQEMRSAGWVATLTHKNDYPRMSVQPIISANQPFFPDLGTAARDWLGLRVYHTHGDGRDGKILVLLPETRAYIQRAEFVGEDTLAVSIAGTELSQLKLHVKGGYWLGGVIHQIGVRVERSEVTLQIPQKSERIDLYLISEDETMFDFLCEDGSTENRISRRGAGHSKGILQEQVREAAKNGEGMMIEFKPFVHLSQQADQFEGKTKLREIVMTAVAFANAEGGKIYLGISDDCEIVGLNKGLLKDAGGVVSVELVKKYLNTVRGKIQNGVRGDVRIEVESADMDGIFVGIIHVYPAKFKPIVLEGDGHLWMRAGASNRKVPPDQWRTITSEVTPPFAQLLPSAY